MLSQFLNQMDDYLANKPFKRRWWSRRWIVYMTIQPPLSKYYPLWKRSHDQLQLLRLFNLSPEELGRKIERYWKKSRWRRWFGSFGMNKKIDVWNYYQRCLAYQAVRPDKLSQESLIVASKGRPLLLNELGLVLHQFNVKFETYLEKRCRNPKWIEKHFFEEMKAYKQQLKKTFLKNLNKSLKQIKKEGDRLVLKQQAEQEYQQIEALMLRYYHQWLMDFFSRSPQPNLVPEVGVEVAQEGNMANPERNIAVYSNSQTVSSPSQSTLPREVSHQIVIPSLHGAKEWIQTQRQCLNSLIEEGSLQKVEELLQTSLHEIKEVTEFYLKSCETLFSSIQDNHEAYDALKYLNNLQSRLKTLLQGGMLLFHPDHMMNLTHSQAMWELITRYSQSYLEQSRCYVDRFKNYHLRIEELYQYSQKKFQRQQSLRDWSDLAHRIQELEKSVKDLEQSFKEVDKKLTEDTKIFWDEQYVKLAQDKEAMEDQRKKDKEAMEAQRKKDKADSDAKQKESEAKLAQYETKQKESEAKLAQYETKQKESDEKIKELTEFMDFIKSQQRVSTSSASDVNMPESSNNVALTIGIRPSL